MKQIKIKKISIGVLAATVAFTPIIAVSCGKSKDTKKKTYVDEVNEAAKSFSNKLEASSKLHYSSTLEIDENQLGNIKTAQDLIGNIISPEIPLLSEGSQFDKVLTNSKNLKNTKAYYDWLDNNTKTSYSSNEGQDNFIKESLTKLETVMEEVMKLKTIQVTYKDKAYVTFTINDKLRHSITSHFINLWKLLNYLKKENVLSHMGDIGKQEDKEFWKSDIGKEVISLYNTHASITEKIKGSIMDYNFSIIKPPKTTTPTIKK